MKRIVCLFSIFLVGCGGNTVAPASLNQSAITPPPAIQGPVVFIGDSITVGWVALATLVPGSINAGVSGQTSVQMLTRFQTDVLDKHPSTVVIAAGTNDILRTTNPNTDSIQQMADLASHAGAKVIIGLVPPNSDWAAPNIITDPIVGNAEIIAFDESLKRLAISYGYSIADYYSVLILPDGSQNTALFRDGTHPNASGYDLMWPVLQKLL